MPIFIKNKNCYKLIQKYLNENKDLKDYFFYKPKTNGEINNSVIIMYNYKNEFLKHYGQISYWDVSLITSTVLLFNNQFKYINNNNDFNEDISLWDVSNVKNMYGMFYNCNTFNQPLNNWDVSNVTYMKYMFYNCISFNQSLNNWNISNVKCFENMLYNCVSFSKKNLKKLSLKNIN